LMHPGESVESHALIIVAGIGIVVNGVAAWLFRAGRKGDLNMHAAFLHLASDAVI